MTAEYLALRRGAAVYPAHEIVWVRGPDTVTFLDGLISQAIEPMEHGDVAPSLLLSPQGKLRAPHWVLRDDEAVGLVTDVGSGEIVASDLRRFKIRVDAVIDEAAAPLLDITGPDAGAVVAALGFGAQREWVGDSDRLAARLPFRGGGGLERFVVGGVAVDDIVAAGAVRVGTVAATAVRVEQGEPVNGIDVDEKTIPAEAHLVAGSVDFDKGCYLGQELVARIDSRGHVNRRLRGLTVSTNVVPPLGAAVRVDDKEVGRVTSVAESLDLRAPVALALIRREVDAGDTVTLTWEGGSAPAAVRDLPML